MTHKQSGSVPQQKVSEELMCPITQELPRDPVTTEDGRVYRKAMLGWIQQQEKKAEDDETDLVLRSPVTNEPMGRNSSRSSDPEHYPLDCGERSDERGEGRLSKGVFEDEKKVAELNGRWTKETSMR